jgi:hypothetical protein
MLFILSGQTPHPGLHTRACSVNFVILCTPRLLKGMRRVQFGFLSSLIFNHRFPSAAPKSVECHRPKYQYNFIILSTFCLQLAILQNTDFIPDVSESAREILTSWRLSWIHGEEKNVVSSIRKSTDFSHSWFIWIKLPLINIESVAVMRNHLLGLAGIDATLCR